LDLELDFWRRYTQHTQHPTLLLLLLLLLLLGNAFVFSARADRYLLLVVVDVNRYCEVDF